MNAAEVALTWSRDTRAFRRAPCVVAVESGKFLLHVAACTDPCCCSSRLPPPPPRSRNGSGALLRLAHGWVPPGRSGQLPPHH